MADKSFGVNELNIIGTGNPSISSPNNLNLNAVNVAISNNVSIGGTLTVTGNVSIAGTLTYEDVTNIDSIGIVTARTGIKVLTGGADINGVVTATTFSGSGASLTSIPAGQLTGTVADARLTTVSSSKLSGALPAISGANLTNLPSDTPADTDVQVTYDISANGNNYRITGPGYDASENNPDLYLVRGQRYRFINTTGSGHPFRIQSDTSGTAYTDNVTGDRDGTQDFNVQNDAPSRLYYQCTIHGGMIGNIYITGGADWRMSDVTTAQTPEISTNLNVGIGLTNPEDKLHVKSGKIRIENAIVANNDSTIAYDNTDFVIDVDPNNVRGSSAFKINVDTVNAVTIDDNRRIGIGTDDPLRQLDIFSTGHATAALKGNTQSSLFFVDNDDSNIGQISYIHADNYMYFRVNDAERLRITSDGKVGIGSEIPDYNLTIGDGSSYVIQNLRAKNDEFCEFRFGDPEGVAQGKITYDNGTDSLRFTTNGDGEKLRITSSGLVGINTTTGFDTSVGLAVRNGASGSDHTMIDIIANTNESSRLVFSDDSDHNQGRIQYNHTGNSLVFYTNGNSEKLRITSAGLVGIGTDNPNQPLHIHASGTSYVRFTDEASGIGATDGVVFGLDHPHLYAWNYEAGDFVVATSAEERFRIADNGDIGINKSSITSWGANIPTIEIKGGAESGGQVGRSGAIAFESGSGTNGYAILWGNEGGIEYYSSATNRATAAYGCKFTSAGNLAFASGKGIDFSARTPDGTGTVTSETLDDYEEGTWTAVVANYTSSVTSSVSNTTGYYTKVGNVVTVTWYSSVMSLSGTQSGAAQIQGLPFVSINTTDVYQSAIFSHTTAFAHTINSGYTVPNESRVLIIQNNSTATTTWNTSGGSRYLMMQLTYLTNT